MFFFERVSRLHAAVPESYPVDAANGSPGGRGAPAHKKGAIPQNQSRSWTIP
jgi:hypothetical protein